MDDFARAQIEALKRRVEDLEHNLRLVFEHTGLDTATLHRDEPAVDPEIVGLEKALLIGRRQARIGVGPRPAIERFPALFEDLRPGH